MILTWMLYCLATSFAVDDEAIGHRAVIRVEPVALGGDGFVGQLPPVKLGEQRPAVEASREAVVVGQHFKLAVLPAHLVAELLPPHFKRSGGHIFDISLHGFPIGMIKSCRKYWSQDIADSIVQLKDLTPFEQVVLALSLVALGLLIIDPFVLERARALVPAFAVRFARDANGEMIRVLERR